MENENIPKSNDELNLNSLILPLWNARKVILISTILTSFLGGIIGFLTPPIYTASSIFLPQTAETGGVAGSLGGLAALAGINLNSPISGKDIPPSMYATVLASEPFKKRVLDTKIWINQDSITYRDYLRNEPSSVLGIIKEYSLGLPWKLIKLFSNPNKNEIGEIGELQPLSDEEYKFHLALSGKVKIENDKKEGVVKLTVIEGDPFVAAQVAIVTEKILQDWIIEHKIKNAKAQYDFIEKQFHTKQKEFFSIQEQLANYTDRNQNVLAASYLTRLDRLQAEFDLVNTVYSELAKQKEQAAIQLSKDTPTFSVLDPVKVPKEKTSPKKSLYVLGALFIGFFCSSIFVLAKKPIENYFKTFSKFN